MRSSTRELVSLGTPQWFVSPELCHSFAEHCLTGLWPSLVLTQTNVRSMGTKAALANQSLGYTLAPVIGISSLCVSCVSTVPFFFSLLIFWCRFEPSEIFSKLKRGHSIQWTAFTCTFLCFDSFTVLPCLQGNLSLTKVPRKCEL